MKKLITLDISVDMEGSLAECHETLDNFSKEQWIELVQRSELFQFCWIMEDD